MLLKTVEIDILRQVNVAVSELEPLVNASAEEEKSASNVVVFKTEYKKKFRPFSQYEYAQGRYTEKPGEKTETQHENNSEIKLMNNTNDSWYKEAVELRKKAGQYKVSNLLQVKIQNSSDIQF